MSFFIEESWARADPIMVDTIMVDKKKHFGQYNSLIVAMLIEKVE